MSNVKSMSRNAVWLTAAEIISKAVAFFAVVLITRYLTREAFGQYNFIIAFGLMFGVVANFGFRAFTTREIAKHKERASEIFSNLFTLKLFLSVFAFVLLFVTAQFVNKPDFVIWGIYLIGAFTVIEAFRGFFASTFHAFEAMHYDALLRIGERLTYIGLLYVAITMGKGILFFIGTSITSALIFLLVALVLLLSKFVKLRLATDFPYWKEIFTATIFFVINDIFIIVFFKVDTIMISLMKGDELTGVYSSAVNLIYASTFVPAILSTVLYPVLTRFYNNNRQAFLENMTLIVKYFILAGIPVVAVFLLFGRDIMHIIYGTKYDDAIGVLQILAFGLFFIFLNYIFSTFLNTAEKQKWVAIGSATAMVVNLGLNFILIPQFDIAGAAFATSFTEGVFSTVLLIFVWKQFKDVFTWHLATRVLKMLGVLIFASVAAYLLLFNVYIAFGVFVLIMVLGTFVLGLWGEKDTMYLREAIGNK